MAYYNESTAQSVPAVLHAIVHSDRRSIASIFIIWNFVGWIYGSIAEVCVGAKNTKYGTYVVAWIIARKWQMLLLNRKLFTGNNVPKMCIITLGMDNEIEE